MIMKQLSLALVGFGNVGQAFTRLLLQKRAQLLAEYDLDVQVTGIATARHGVVIAPGGLDLDQVLDLASSGQPLGRPGDIFEFIEECPADALFENTPVNHQTGRPASDYLRAALARGMHAISANKGPVVHAYAELMALARQTGRRFLFESAVMDGAPIFSLFRGSLPAANLLGFSGILNSCTNLILDRMAAGESFEAAVRYAQSIGIAETDPGADIDGWDAAIKVAALSTVLMDAPMKPQDVEREGIRGINPRIIGQALESGERWKLVCSARIEDGRVLGRVRPERVGPESPLFTVSGTSSYVEFKLDVLPGLGIIESNPGPETTAYGLLADLINAVRGV